MKKACSLLCAVFILPLLAGGQEVREAQFAGRFYDASAAALSRQIEDYLRQAKKGPVQAAPLRVLIVPHAGYSCSGPVAAHAYTLVQGLDFETVVIMGTSHQAGLRGCSIYPEGGYRTPLGVAEVDSALAREIMHISGYSFSPRAHLSEHSIEVQIPFIQKVLPRAKIVPILMGAPTPRTISTLAQSLVQALQGKNVLVVASTDLSHYYPKEKANAIDTETVELIKTLQVDPLVKKIQRGENIMCGGGGVVAALLYAQEIGKAKIEILRYSDSSETCGPPSEVVGYLAAAGFIEAAGRAGPFSEESKHELLRLARSAIVLFVQDQAVIRYSPQSPELLVERGVFVTLKKNGMLRGCIGFVEPPGPLHLTVAQAAIYASVKDPRFNPVVPDELDTISIEISILTPMRRIDNPTRVQLGKHGLFIKSGGKSGLLLPQVPVENGWSKTTFLEQACLKAGLPKKAWKSDAEIYVFEAVVFHD